MSNEEVQGYSLLYSSSSAACDEPEGCATVANSAQGQANPGAVDQIFDRWTGSKGIYRPAAATLAKIPAGIYSAEQDPRGIYLEAKRFPSDFLLDLPGLPTRLILNEVKDFWAKEKRFRQFGFLHKRGIMMCGPGGCGKTSIIRMVSSDVIADDGLVLLIQQIPVSVLAMAAIREIEERRALLTVTEDLDEYFKPGKNNHVKQVLSMYDGENQVDHVMHIATTNHPEELEDRIIQRPSRFDMVLLLGTPNRAAREAYLRNILHTELEEGVFQQVVDDTKGLSLSHLKEYVVSVVVLEKPSKPTLARLHENMKKKPRLPDDKGGSLGFHGEGYQIWNYDEEKNKYEFGGGIDEHNRPIPS